MDNMISIHQSTLLPNYQTLSFKKTQQLPQTRFSKNITMLSPRGKEVSKSRECSFRCCLTAQLSVSAASHDQRSINDSSTLRYDFATATSSSLYPHLQFTNHESLPNQQDSFHSFLKAFPQFLQTVEADQARIKDYPHLSTSNHVCLDFIGHGLFSYPQQMGPDFISSVASTSTSAPQPTYSKIPSFEIAYKPAPLNSQIELGEGESDFESHVRKRIMRFLNILDEDYSLVFTANQASAFTVLAESYPFKKNKNIVTVYDHENEAVEAMVESSKRRGARAVSAEFKWPSLKIHSNKLKEVITNKSKRKKGKKGLFVFPLQSRVSGARYSYQWMNIAQENDWHVLLDATALGPKDMDTLGLSLFRPDFLICTCYKVFGLNPYGFGCLFVKKSNAAIFIESIITPSRGIVNLVLSSALPINETTSYSDANIPSNPDEQGDEESASSTFSGEIRRTGGEHSTTDLATEIQFKGLDIADSLGLVIISSRSRYLINWLINAMLSLRYPNSENSQQLVSIYGPRVRFDRAPILAFNMFDWKGEKVDPILVQKLADRNNISVGCGFVKRIWFGERYEGEKARVLERKKGGKDEKLKGGNKRRENGDECGIAVVTITIGFLNNFEDVYRLWGFVARFLDADFVEKERWRYTALNQRTVEV